MNPVDYAGKTFGRYTVIKDVPQDPGEHRRVVAKCSCGKTKNLLLQHLKSGRTQSCGCLLTENRASRRAWGWACRRGSSPKFIGVGRVKYKPGAYCVAFFNRFGTNTRTEVFPEMSFTQIDEYGKSKLNGTDREGYVLCKVLKNSKVNDLESYDPK